MKYILELIYYCFCFSLVCVVARGKNPLNILCFYPKNLKEKAIELGLSTNKKINIQCLFILLSLTLVMASNLYLIVCIWNKSQSFTSIFLESLFFLQLWNIYDACIMDKLWPEKNDFWMIPEIKHLWSPPTFKEIFFKRLPYVPALIIFSLLAALFFPLI